MGVIANKIPEKTTPLTKFVRTGEGVLVFAFNLTMLIVPIVSNALSPEDAVKWAGIVNGVAVISRTGLKIVAEFSKATGIEPQPIGNPAQQVITADAGGSANNGGAPEVVDPSDSEEFDSTPTVDDDAVEVTPTPVVVAPPDPMVTPPDPVIAAPPVVVTPPAPVQTVAADSTDPQVSDEEEFADVPPASDDASGSPNPVVINAGGAVS